MAPAQTLAGMCATAVIAYCSYAMCRTPILPLFARDLGADPPLVGLVMAASTVAGVLLKLPAGALSDTMGRRPLLLAGALVFAALPFGYLWVASLGVLAALRFVHGSATAIFGPVASATISDVAPSARRGTWLSTYATLQGTGQALGPVLAGYLLVWGGFELVFGVAAAIGLSAPLIIGRLVPIPAASGGGRVGRAALAQGVLEVAREPLVLLTSTAQAAMFALSGTLNAFLPLYASETIGVTGAGLGWLFGVQTLTTLAMRPVTGMLSDRAGRRGVIVAGLAVCCGAVLLVSTATTLRSLVPSVMLFAAGVATTSSAASAFITDMTRRTRYGAAHGVFGTIYDIGDAGGPITAGLLVAVLGYSRTFQIMAGVGATVMLLFAWGSRRIPNPVNRPVLDV